MNAHRVERLLALSADRGVEPRPDDGGRQLASEATEATYWVVNPSDLVFNPMWALEGSVAVSELRGAVSTAYRVYELSDRVHPRFLHHFMRSSLALEQYRALVRGVTTFDRAVTRDDLEAMPVPVPPVSEQRAIADFLDAETSRINALIANKRRMIDLSEERFWGWVTDRLATTAYEEAALRRVLTTISDGPFGSSLKSSHYSAEGARVVRLGNIGFAQFKDDDKAFIPIAHYETLLKHRVLPGDLLIAGLGDSRYHVGRACVAPDLGPAIVKADCYRAHVDQRRCDPGFLALVLSSPSGAARVAIAARGTTRSRINLDIAKEVVVPLPPLDEQKSIVAEASAGRKKLETLAKMLERQLALLQEHRQALITAAVTGELEVPGAAA